MSARAFFLTTGLAAATAMSAPSYATPVAPTDYFVQATTSSVFGTYSSGPIAGPVAQNTAPDSAVYYSSSTGNFSATSGTFVESGSASASADFATATLHAAAGPTLLARTVITPPGWNARAILGDTLHFTNANATASTITTVTFNVHVDGTSSASVGTSSGGSAQFSLDIGATAGIGTPSAFAPVASRCFIGGATTNCVYSEYGFSQSWGNAFSGDPVVDETITGAFSFKGQSADVVLEMLLSVGGQYYFMDYSHTAAFSFDQLPTGVSYSSASGQFLTATESIPEPGMLASLVLGLPTLMLLRRGARPEAR